MKYRKGYKYQLAEGFMIQTALKSKVPIETEFISLSKNGLLYIESGYAFDGPSGPTWDTDNFMTPSLVHDAGYQLIRMALLPPHTRQYFDKLLIEMCKEREMSSIRRWWVYKGVRLGAGFAASPKNKKEVYEVA